MVVKKRLKSVIFDFDGVILDSFANRYNWFKHISNVLGKPFEHSKEEFKDLYCEPVYPDLYNVLGLEWKKNMEVIWKEYNSWERDVMVEIFPHIKEAMNKLRDAGLELAIASSNTRKSINQQLDYNCIADYFNVVVTMDDIPQAGGEVALKPDPACLLIALEELGHAPEDSIYVGDQPSDIVAAKNVAQYLGRPLRVVAVEYGYSDAVKLLREKPDAIVVNRMSVANMILSHYI